MSSDNPEPEDQSVHKQNRPKYELKKDPNYKSVYTTGAYGGLDIRDGHILFYADQIEPEIDEKSGKMKVGKVVRNLIVDIRMTPAEFMSLANWINQHVKRYEEDMKELKTMHEKSELAT